MRTFRTDVNIYPRRNLAFVLLVNEGHLVDHFISTTQLTNTVESIVLGYPPLPVSQGWSVRWMGWGLGILVFGLVVLHTRNFYTLFKQGKKHFEEQSISKKILAAWISILIPTVILIIVFSQIQNFFGKSL